MLRLPGESTSEISRKIRESFANVPLKSRFPAWGPPTFPKLHHPVLVAGTRIGLSCAWLYLAQLSHRCCKWPWVAVETFNHLLGSCCKMSLPILWYYDMFRLMLARHGCRTMLRDEAAKDPRKISFFPRWMAIPGWKNIDQPPYSIDSISQDLVCRIMSMLVE